MARTVTCRDVSGVTAVGPYPMLFAHLYNHRFVTYMASNDVASNNCQAHFQTTH